VFGQETGVLYQYETSSGLVWKTFGNEKLQPKYEGEITNGKPDGFGFMTYPYDGKSVMGEWKNGKEWNTKHTKKDGTFIGKFENGEWIVSWGVFYIGIRSEKVDLYEEKWDGVESEDNKDYGTYEGEIKNRLPNGHGTITIFGASKYVGEFKLGKRIGQGTKTYPDGRKYVGEFKNGLLNGQGTYTNPDGRKFVGEFKDGSLNGQGTYTNPDGTKYVGEWKNGKEWNTKHTKKDGTLIGKFENGKWIVSWGVLYFGLRNGKYGWEEDGDEKKNSKYVGEVKYGIPYGQGTYSFPNGDKYVGEFKDGKPNGQGTYTSPEGYKYIGVVKDGKRHGQGTGTLPDGEKYDGEFKDGGKNGQGTFTYYDGDKYVGEFKDDEPWNGTTYDKNGNIYLKYVNGK